MHGHVPGSGRCIGGASKGGQQVEQVEQRLLLAVHSCLSGGQEEMDKGNVGDGQGTIMGNPDGHDEDQRLIGFEGGENLLIQDKTKYGTEKYPNGSLGANQSIQAVYCDSKAAR